jgi:protein SCO1/2
MRRRSVPGALLLGALWLAILLPGRGVLSAAEMKLADYEVGGYPMGGDFTLTNQDGGTTRLADLRGKAVLLTFGYTHCADVCPTTLAQFKQVRQALGADAARLQAVFISVDPRRDTPAHLKKYVGFFDPTFVALTGKPAVLEALIERYMGKFRIHESTSAAGYQVDHTAFIYLLDAQGKVRYLFAPDTNRTLLVAGVRAVLAGKP